MSNVQEIIGKEETRELRGELNDLLATEGCDYEQVEDLLLSYGLEMDYFFGLI